MLVLAVKQDQVRESLLWEWRIVQQEVKLFESITWLSLNVHQSGIMEGHRIELVLVTRWHIKKSLSGSTCILHSVLNSSLKVESFNKSSLFKSLSVTNTFNFDTVSV